ncbi:MAG: pantoate--beta-alanine ligase [Deltaproteobacteria bacterium HGW-Deltaproteobacteria-8]|jgi:pantoate--beta-alanine ligase|nr:MAG: pantoate--beta-alanine ligase [Deltaproteobacteria bacterium HGW-Deltaproteobacteria-8]
MDLLADLIPLRQHCQAWRTQGLSIALVPTMGFLHAGHLSLMDYARTRADRLVVSVFVNPTQFGPNEDLDRYPRDLPRDLELAAAHGVDLVFAPEPQAMYFSDHATWVEVPELAKGLCGASRPVHFRGVCTVVTKLFGLVRPDVAVFGQKDWQQLAILKRMSRDLELGVEVVGRPIFREPDGLAMSSRNVNLTPEEREKAPAIRQGLLVVQAAVRAGERDAAKLALMFRAHLAEKLTSASVDYADFVHPESMSPVVRVEGPTLFAVAVFLGRVRLIDNILLEV